MTEQRTRTVTVRGGHYDTVQQTVMIRKRDANGCPVCCPVTICKRVWHPTCTTKEVPYCVRRVVCEKVPYNYCVTTYRCETRTRMVCRTSYKCETRSREVCCTVMVPE